MRNGTRRNLRQYGRNRWRGYLGMSDGTCKALGLEVEKTRDVTSWCRTLPLDGRCCLALLCWMVEPVNADMIFTFLIF